jgi:HupE / UreJ protein
MSQALSGRFQHPRLRSGGGAAYSSGPKRAGLLLFALLLFVGASAGARAHDIPGELLLRAYLKPEGETLHFVVRVPLALLQGIGFPKRGPGFLKLGQLGDSPTRAAQAVARELVVYRDGVRLTPDRAAMRISQPSEDAFGSFEEARDHIAGPPLPETTDVFWNQGYFDVHLKYPIPAGEADFGLDMRAAPGLAGSLKLIIDFLPPEGPGRTFQVHGGQGWLELDPSWYGAFWTFTRLGFKHILEGIDHLLFLFCLVLPFRVSQFGSLVGIITAFTVAHSITLIAGAAGWVPAGDWFPPLIEALIAISILYMALENILSVWLGSGSSASLRWRWLVAGAFGLVHGFGFSFVLQQDLQLAGSHLLLSLLAFNFGVELGQLAVLLLVVPILAVLLQRPKARPACIVILSALLGHIAWHWMVERLEALRFVRWPTLDPAALWLLAGLALLGLIGVALWLSRRQPQDLTGERRSASSWPGKGEVGSD